MRFWNKILTSVVAVSMLGWEPQCSGSKAYQSYDTWNDTEVLNQPNTEIKENLDIREKENLTKKALSICLETDENSFTHNKVLESVTDPNNTILELPLSQLFERYWNRSHPLVVRWIKRDFMSLLWKDWIEDLSDKIPQKLSPRAEKITSDTQYEAWDTLRFALINPFLEWAFPKYLSDQLKEDWFQSFSDLDSKEITKRIKNKNQNIKENTDKKTDFVYDIVVKKIPTWECALAIYRDWELFMATYVSVWLNSRKTNTWQFKVLRANPYYFSRKYKSPMSDCLYYDEKWCWVHQGRVNKWPASHWCVREPWVYADISYSLIYPVIKKKDRVDVFISKNLYK